MSKLSAFPNEPLLYRLASKKSKYPLIMWRRTNLKEGEGALAPEKMLLCPSTFFSSTSIISRFGERFSDGRYSLVSFLFAVQLLAVPPCPAIVKVGGTCPVPYRVGATAPTYHWDLMFSSN